MYFNNENVFNDATVDNIGIGIKVGILRSDWQDGHIIIENSLSAPVGFVTNVAMTPKQLSFLPKAHFKRFQVECIDENKLKTINILKYFKTYNPILCKLECNIDRIYAKYKCKPLYAPKTAPG